MAYTKRRDKAAADNPTWWLSALSVLKPPEELTVSEWADRYRILDSKTSAEPGRWNTDRTPYLRGIMDAFTDPDVEEIDFIKSTQVGGTECLNNLLGFIIAQDQSPTMFVYPTIELAEFTSKNRLRPMIELSPALAGRYQDRESTILEMRFDGMYVVLAGSNSPSGLASRPIRYLMMDEIDKYPSNSGKEADPRKLAEERTKTFAHNKKIVKTSTPTLRSGPIWQEWLSCTRQLQNFVPCPHCGHMQTLRFKQLKWPEKADREQAQRTAYYECEQCARRITDSHKPAMLKAGEWRVTSGAGKKKTGFWINALYSPWARFGDVAYEFLCSKDDPDTLMNFVNSWLAEPWEDTKLKTNADMVLSRTSGLPEGLVPRKALLLTGGVDVQRNGFYFTVRAWGEKLISWNIAHGFCQTWAEVEQAMNFAYPDEDGGTRVVDLCMIDSGDQTDEVYDFVVDNQEWAAPCKGSNTPLASRYRMSRIDKFGSRANGLSLYTVDGSFFKSMIMGRVNREGDGSWMVYADCDRDYAEQICSEEKVVERVRGREVEVWRKKGSHTANHYLDCEVYAALAAEVRGVRYMMAEVEQPSESPPPTGESNQKGWLPGKGWLPNKGGSWL